MVFSLFLHSFLFGLLLSTLNCIFVSLTKHLCFEKYHQSFTSYAFILGKSPGFFHRFILLLFLIYIYIFILIFSSFFLSLLFLLGVLCVFASFFYCWYWLVKYISVEEKPSFTEGYICIKFIKWQNLHMTKTKHRHTCTHTHSSTITSNHEEEEIVYVYFHFISLKRKSYSSDWNFDDCKLNRIYVWKLVCKYLTFVQIFYQKTKAYKLWEWINDFKIINTCRLMMQHHNVYFCSTIGMHQNVFDAVHSIGATIWSKSWQWTFSNK